MKLKLTFIAVLLCTLFFACKKNEILNDETGRVSAIGLSGPVSTDGPTDLPCEHNFGNCTNVPPDVPFYIDAGMFQVSPDDYEITFAFHENQNYIGIFNVNSVTWHHCIRNRSMAETGDFPGDCLLNPYQGNSLDITINKIQKDIELSVTCIVTTSIGNTYNIQFNHTIDLTKILTTSNYFTTFNLDVTKGTSTNCDCSHCSNTYTLILP